MTTNNNQFLYKHTILNKNGNYKNLQTNYIILISLQVNLK